MSNTRMDPSTRFVRSLDGEYFMVREAAEMLGVSSALLRNAMKEDNEKWGPSFCAWFGKVKIYLYTRADIERIDELLKDRKRVFRNTVEVASTGRPLKWSPEERSERQRLYSASHYYRKRVQTLKDEGRTEEQAAAQARVDEIDAQLRKQEEAKNK